MYKQILMWNDLILLISYLPKIWLWLSKLCNFKPKWNVCAIWYDIKWNHLYLLPLICVWINCKKINDCYDDLKYFWHVNNTESVDVNICVEKVFFKADLFCFCNSFKSCRKNHVGAGFSCAMRTNWQNRKTCFALIMYLFSIWATTWWQNVDE